MGLKYGILGDIHSNRQALAAVLDHLRELGATRLLSVGDVVGYGGNPSECIEMLQANKALVVAGNHDQAVTGLLDSSFFNHPARVAVAWTRANLTEGEIQWLKALPLVALVDGRVSVAHATFHEPAAFKYIQSFFDAALSLSAMETPVGFLGHSHVPGTFILGDSLLYSESPSLSLPKSSKALINVGSIGQPRDENPKAACALYDSETGIYELHRVIYDIDAASEAIREAGLPEMLAGRLGLGR